LSLPPEQLARGLVTASWGNVGSAVAYVGHLLGVSTTVYMGRPFASREMVAAIERWGAEVVVQGTTWDATERIASEQAAERGISYIHPFADPALIAGDATVAIDVIESIPDLTTLVVPASAGGGLISGVTPVAAVLMNRVSLPTSGSLCAIVGASGEEGLF
jgi:threonine dehydratase